MWSTHARRGQGRELALWALTLAFGCGGGGATRARDGGPPALAPVCGPDAPCAGGARCLDGQCVQLCAHDTDCGTRERCATDGALAGLCVSRGTAAPLDACAGKLCAGATPACHPTTGACVACTSASECSGNDAVCNRALGSCTGAEAVLCAPCNGDADCGSSADKRACVALDVPFERVCVPGCDDDSGCPPGFACSPTRKACLPEHGSCTSYRAGVRGDSCMTAADCSAPGLPAGSVLSGVCSGSKCALGCEQTLDCPGTMLCSGLVCVPGADGGLSDGGV
jgi:hypothetical protein